MNEITYVEKPLTLREKLRLLDIAAQGGRLGELALALLDEAAGALQPVLYDAAPPTPAAVRHVERATGLTAEQILAAARSGKPAGAKRAVWVIASDQLYAGAVSEAGEDWRHPGWTTQLREAAHYDNKHAAHRALAIWQAHPVEKEEMRVPGNAAPVRMVLP